jgi:L-asparaginase
MSSRIHLVATGGTVGSKRGNGATELEEAERPRILDFLPDGAECGWSSPFSILSEDATSAHWTLLARHIAALPLHRLDAVVVAHGSDTLAWTSAALSYLLRGIPVPVVVTGADLPLEDPASNGPDNFRSAIAFATGERIPGVFACWRHPGEEAEVHLGTRLLPADPHRDRFRPAAGTAWGRFGAEGFVRLPHSGSPSRADLAERSGARAWNGSRSLLEGDRLFEDRVLVLPDQPGLDHSGLAEGLRRWKAVVQLAHHSGTAASAEGTGSFVGFAREARDAGVPVFAGPSGRHEPYASVLRLREAGVRSLPDCAWPALVVKIRHLLAIGSLDLLDEDLAWELLAAGRAGANFPRTWKEPKSRTGAGRG